MKKIVFTTEKAGYDCYKSTASISGVETTAWFVKAMLGDVKAEFQCPENWGVTRLFQFIESIDSFV